MFSKFFVLRCTRSVPLLQKRGLGGLTPLEKFEKLRKLCCKSYKATKNETAEEALRPKVPDPLSCTKTCTDCCGSKIWGYINPECKIAFVIGGASGIGYETANYLLKVGVAKVIIGDIDAKTGLQVTKKLCKTYGKNKAVFRMVDILEAPTVEAAFQESYNLREPVDIYVNTAGIYNETPQCWDKMILTNLTGCVRGTLIAYGFMSNNQTPEGGVILNVSSFGPIGNVPSMPMFSAASNGIIGLTSSFGQDFHYGKTGLRCVTVCPSCTDSGLLKNMVRKHYDPGWAGFSNSAMKCCTKQSAKFVGRAIVHAIKFGESGATYVIKEGKYYKYLIPDYEKIIRQESVLF